MLVHKGILDKTSAFTVGIFLPLLWGAIKGDLTPKNWTKTRLRTSLA